MPVDKRPMVPGYDWQPDHKPDDDGGFGSFVLIFFLCAGFLLGVFVWGEVWGYKKGYAYAWLEVHDAPTKYVDVPGPTVYVDVPGPERVVKVPGPVRYETKTVFRTKFQKWCPANELNEAELLRLRDGP